MVSTGGCCGSIPVPRVQYKEPAALYLYDHYLVDKINVYIDRFAKAEGGELKFIFRNFLIFRYVDVEGIKLI